MIYQGSGARKNANIPIQKIPTLSFDQERLKRRALDRWAIQEITVPDDGVAMAKAIQNGTAIAVATALTRTEEHCGLYSRDV
jgi:hypothetical protein